ncbi:MAG TPA: GTP 3',8-cyclase MoaA [Saprospiraceae bacterium]|nr:GTP 3',8-cyclase MoaA [Saprospiraceae bacterium]HNT20733.1 GTP 3',8-cyclase MoaA [Saprospiraceae bacterium]
MIQDKHGRVHTYLRISLTDNCNLRCFYCMPEEDYEFTPASRLMQAAEIETLARTFVDLGVNKIRLTGGEPLVRKDAADIILRLSRLPVKLTLTTNATRVHEFIDVFKEAGIRSLNVSLDTLDRDRFLFMTRRDQFQRTLDNIRLLVDQGFHVKINMVVMKGLNESEIPDFVAWTKKEPIHVRFIEFMPFEGNRWTSNKVFTLQEMLELIGSRFEIEALLNGIHDTDKKFRALGHAGTFAVISTMSSPFCAGCNRIRLTADGKIKNCLFSKTETDLLTALRKGEDVVRLIHQNIGQKAKELGGQFDADIEHIHPEEIHNRSMITIGG